jgi:AcrR family transcriptional regulator
MSPRAYRSPARAEAAEQTRQRLIAAATALLRNHGPEACSLEAVAKAAGVTRLTVYKRFGSRVALLEAVFDSMAEKGPLQRIPQAMSDPDPVAGLRQLIAIFCNWWAANAHAMASLHKMQGDQEFEERLRARNERRRNVLAVLVKRMVAARKIKSRAANDLVDLLFALTGFAVCAELARGRSAGAAQKLIQNAAEDALIRAGMKI